MHHDKMPLGLVRWYMECAQRNERHVDSWKKYINNSSRRASLSMLDHCVVDDGDEALFIATLLFRLCVAMDACDELIDCVHRLAKRLKPSVRISMFSQCLKACPHDPLRGIIMLYGGRLDPTDPHYYEYACGNGMIDVINERYERGGDDDDQAAMAVYACTSGNVDMVRKIVVERGYRCDSFDMVFIDDDLDVAQVLHAAGVLDLAMAWSKVLSVNSARWLVSHGAPLDDAVVRARHRADVLRYLADECHAPVPSNALAIASHDYPDMSVIDFFLRHGADVNARDDDGCTVMHYTPLYARFWFDVGFDESLLNVVDSQSFTVLHHCMLQCMDGVLLSWLLNNYKFNLDARDGDNNTPLHYACLLAHSSSVKLLLEHGCDALAKNNAGQTPSDMGNKQIQEIIAGYLLQI